MEAYRLLESRGLGLHFGLFLLILGRILCALALDGRWLGTPRGGRGLLENYLGIG